MILVGHGFFWLDRDILVKNDLEANLLQIRYLRMTGWSSNFNPYIGLPVWEDPLLGVMNPVWAIPLLGLESAQTGVKIAFFASLMLSGMGVYFLARSQKVGFQIALLLAMTFVISGYPTARIIAGHSEKVLSLAFMPWILLLLLGRKKDILAGFFIAVTLWSGDIYTYAYSVIIAGLLGRFGAVVWAGILGMVRIMPILLISGSLYKPVEPLAGRQNLFSIVYHLFLPIKYFWDRFGLMKWVPTNFAWWEKASYIGIVPAVSLFFIGKKNRMTLLIWGLVILSMTGLGLGIIRLFHVPTRVFGYLSLVILVYAGGIVKNRYVWTINLVFCLSLSWFAYTNRALPKLSPQVNRAVEAVEPGSTVAFDQLQNPVHVLAAQEKGIFMTATNYGFMLKGSDASKWLEFRVYGKNYTESLPDYIIYSNKEDIGYLDNYYDMKYQFDDIWVYHKI